MSSKETTTLDEALEIVKVHSLRMVTHLEDVTDL